VLATSWNVRIFWLLIFYLWWIKIFKNLKNDQHKNSSHHKDFSILEWLFSKSIKIYAQFFFYDPFFLYLILRNIVIIWYHVLNNVYLMKIIYLFIKAFNSHQRYLNVFKQINTINKLFQEMMYSLYSDENWEKKEQTDAFLIMKMVIQGNNIFKFFAGTFYEKKNRRSFNIQQYLSSINLKCYLKFSYLDQYFYIQWKN
jgi:hypothetical protein